MARGIQCCADHFLVNVIMSKKWAGIGALAGVGAAFYYMKDNSKVTCSSLTRFFSPCCRYPFGSLTAVAYRSRQKFALSMIEMGL